MRPSLTLLSLAITLSLSACGEGTGSNPDTGDNNDTETQNSNSSTDSSSYKLGDNPARNLSVELNQGNSVTIDLAKFTIPDNSNIKIVLQPNHGIASTPQNNKTTYRLKEAYTGSDTFKYAITTADGTQYEYSVSVNVAEPTIKKLEVSSWKGNAKAAYSIIHDDYCSGDSKTVYVKNGYEELKKRGLVGGFGVIVSYCTEDEFADLHKMEDDGMEVINHSWSHLDLTATETNLDTEIDQAHATLIAKKFDVSYFAFPYDAENDAILQRIRDLTPTGYLAARGGGNRSINAQNMDTVDELAPFRTRFDCFDIHQDYIKKGDASCSEYAESTNNDPIKILNLYLDEAITKGGWGVRELHGVGVDGSWGWVSQDEYKTHLDYVATKVNSGDLWMDTPTNITRYRASRAYCGSPSSTAGKIDFDAPTNSAGCIKYATKLDLIATIDGVSAISARQDGKDLEVKSLGGNRYLFPAHPLGGKVTLLRK